MLRLLKFVIGGSHPRYFFILFCLLMNNVMVLYGQASGTALIISEDSCYLVIDGETKLSIVGNRPVSIELSEGQHIIQNKSSGEHQVIDIEGGKQIVVQLKRDDSQEINKIEDTRTSLRLADLSINVPGGLTLGAHVLAELDYETDGTPFFPYFFQKGDDITINIERLNKKGTYTLEIYSYPEGVKVYSHYRFDGLVDQKVRIHHDGIYVIEIGTNHVFDRKVRYTLDRTPFYQDDSIVSSRVEKRIKFDLVTVQKPTEYWVNSTSNETWKGGSSRITIPVNLPYNTKEWYYVFSASRSNEETKEATKTFDLAGKLAELMLGAPGMAVSLGLDVMSSPPGSDYCDVFLVDHTNAGYFRQGRQFSYWVEGSRENVMSGSIKMVKDHGKSLQLGFRNRNSLHGISVGVEVVALVFEEYYSQVDEP